MGFIKKILQRKLVNLLMGLDRDTRAKLYRFYADAALEARYSEYRKKYAIADTFRFNGKDIQFYGNGSIECGPHSYIGHYSTLQAADDCFIKIGSHCSVSHNVRVYTTTNVTNQDFNTAAPRQKTHGNVTIGNGVWIGANVLINPGITIGDNAVIGANAVVTTDIPADCIAGGVPARIIKYKKYEK